MYEALIKPRFPWYAVRVDVRAANLRNDETVFRVKTLTGAAVVLVVRDGEVLERTRPDSLG